MNVKMKHLMTALIASAAVSQAVHAQEAPSAVAQDTKQVEQAADGTGPTRNINKKIE